jgi:hypothetical protein
VKLITIVLFAATGAFAQTAESRMPVTDADRIADGLRAGPAFVTKDAMLLNWPSIPGGEFRVLRKGSSQWTCLPAKFARNSGTCFAHRVTPPSPGREAGPYMACLNSAELRKTGRMTVDVRRKLPAWRRRRS